jgi:hypothetical protein
MVCGNIRDIMLNFEIKTIIIYQNSTSFTQLVDNPYGHGDA